MAGKLREKSQDKHHCRYRSISIHRKGKFNDEVFNSPKEVFEGKCILEPTKGECPLKK